MDTGKIKAVIKKSHFNLFKYVYFDKNSNGSYEEDELIVGDDRTNGGQQTQRDNKVQYDSDRTTGLRVTVESRGPVMTIIKATAPTVFNDGPITPTVKGGTGQPETTHGFTCRMYFYKDQSFVKVEYTLQNSDKNYVYTYPMYFKDFSLKLKTTLHAHSKVRFGGEIGTKNYYEGTISDGGLYCTQRIQEKSNYKWDMDWSVRKALDDSLVGSNRGKQGQGCRSYRGKFIPSFCVIGLVSLTVLV